MTDEASPHIVVEWTHYDESGNTKQIYYGPFDGYDAADDWCRLKMERDDRYFIIPLIRTGATVPEVTLCSECEETIIVSVPDRWWKEAGIASDDEKLALRVGDVMCNECAAEEE